MTSELPQSGSEGVRSGEDTSLLSSMARVYELSGIEPSMWYSPDEFDENDSRIIIYKEQLNFTRPRPIDFNMPCRKSYPYYPESQLWDIARQDEGIDVCVLGEFLKSNRDDLHTALVEMVEWCLENNHIKKKGEK